MSYQISVTLEDIETGEKEILFDREKSNCSFKKTIDFENYEIQLRLDWDDLVDGKPRLDTDIRDKITGKLIKNGQWHHTDPEFNKSERRTVYPFNFEPLQLRLGTIMTMGIDYKATVVIGKQDNE